MKEALVHSRDGSLCAGFRLLEKLGAGGQAEVWRARDDARGIELALKVLPAPLGRNPEAWAALEREYGIARILHHPGILRVEEPRRDGDAAVLPMELVPGGDLRKLRGADYLTIV